jgi:hypothetical protein
VKRLAFVLLPLLIAIVPALAPAAAHAQAIDSTTRSTARQLGTEGVQAYEEGRYDEASDKLERAYQLLKAPSLALWSGRALERRGNLVEASERYLEATRLPIEGTDDKSVQQKAQADALAAHGELQPRIPRLLIEVHGATSSDVKLTIGGTAVPSAVIGTPIPVDPKRIEVEAEHEGHTVRADVSVGEGSSAKVVIRFDGNRSSAEVTATSATSTGDGPAPDAATDDTPTDPPRDQRPRQPGPNLVGPIVLLAAGGAVLISGIVLLATANDCYYGYCIEDSDKVTAGAVLTPIGIGLAAGGGIWLGIKVSKHKKAATTASAGLTLMPVRAGVGVGVAGTF